MVGKVCIVEQINADDSGKGLLVLLLAHMVFE